MKILHVMQDSAFRESIVRFMNHYYDNRVHEVCYFLSNDQETYVLDDIKINQFEFTLASRKVSVKETLRFMRFQRQYDYIVLHSFFINPRLALFFALNPKRIVWIAWGFDLYDDISNDNRNRIKSKVKRLIKSHVGTFVGIFPPDCEVFRREFPRTKAQIFYAPYRTDSIDPVLKNYNLESRLRKTKEENDTVFIQVGHNAKEDLNHLAVLEMLSKFSHENIHIFLPMSYGGSAEYISKVTGVAKKLFHGKCTVLTDFLPLSKYNEISDRIDIAVFAVERQIGLGNITRMIAKNVKLYMPSQSIMYNYFTNRGIPIQPTEGIEISNYTEFTTPIDYSEHQGVREYIEECISVDYLVEKWETVFDSLKR